MDVRVVDAQSTSGGILVNPIVDFLERDSRNMEVHRFCFRVVGIFRSPDPLIMPRATHPTGYVYILVKVILDLFEHS